MSRDDDRVAELAGDGGVSLDPAEQAELEELRALLADPAVWAEPDPSLEDRVVSAITTESSQRPGRPVATRPHARSRRPWMFAVVGVAAAALIALAVSFSLRSGTSSPQFSMALKATELVPGAQGNATLTKTDSGWRDRAGCHRPAPPRQRPLLPGLAPQRRWRAGTHRHVQRGPEGDAVGGRVAGGLPHPHGHPGGRRRRAGVVGSAGPRRPDQHRRLRPSLT